MGKPTVTALAGAQPVPALSLGVTFRSSCHHNTALSHDDDLAAAWNQSIFERDGRCFAWTSQMSPVRLWAAIESYCERCVLLWCSL